MASDNIEMLRALGADPLFIKATRVDAIAGLVELMDIAAASVDEPGRPAPGAGRRARRDRAARRAPGDARAPDGPQHVHRDRLPRRLAHAAARPAARRWSGTTSWPGSIGAPLPSDARHSPAAARSAWPLQRCRDPERGVQRAACRPRPRPRPAARRGSPPGTPRSRASARRWRRSGAARARCPGRPGDARRHPCARSWRSPAEKSIEM